MDEMDRNGESDAESDLFWESELSLYIPGLLEGGSSAAAGSELELCINADSPSSQYVNNQLWITRGN